jgi:hypothetical protein
MNTVNRFPFAEFQPDGYLMALRPNEEFCTMGRGGNDEAD